MKIRPRVACFDIIVLLLTAPAASAQSLPQLRQGMPYVQARQLLLGAGWQADIVNPNHLEELQQRLTGWFHKKGYAEISNCMPTGLGLCSGAFKNVRGQCLSISTSEPPDENEARGPKLVEWQFVRGACKGR